ncbi:MAG TPA: signal peptidase I [Gemmatimonadaceae bacterium]|nr:signal peptidase I [Gemmatimonadaceae bacterium]
MVINSERRRAALDRANHAPTRRLGFVRDQLRTLAMALVLFLVVRAFLVEAFKIPSASMEGTLLTGDFLLVNKLVYGAEVPFVRGRTPSIRAPRRGDVVVFQWPADRTKNFVKRVVGLPGDTLSMRYGRLALNGRDQPELYAQHSQVTDRRDSDFGWQTSYLAAAIRDYRPSRDNWGPLVVPFGNYFVLGDNRENSLDSRYWGFVPDSLIRGQPLVVYYSFDSEGLSPGGWLSRVRWRRLGALIQ